MANPNWIKGGPSPNPGGKPRGLADLRRKLSEHSEDLHKSLLELCGDEDKRIKLDALKLAYAYLYGRPTDASAQPAEATTPPKLEEVRAMMQAGAA